MQTPNQVTLKPSDHAFTVKAGETILDAALREGFVISYGCRNGACGTCKGKVLSGTVDYGNHQASALPESEKRQGFALFCQARPLGDVVIECREVGATRDIQIRTLPARVQKMQKLAPDIMLVELKLPASERLQFLAGQYIDFLLKDGARRSFSIATPPHAAELIELHVRHVAGGQFTDHVFQKMKEVNPGVKAILASGYFDPNVKMDLLKAGAKDFIQKPYIPDQILKRIREVIDEQASGA